MAESPWPHLDSMFRCLSLNEKTCKFLCLLCAPKHKEVSAYRNSPSNLRKHVESPDGELQLPPHHRCACHTLNLVACNDAAMAEGDPAYKKLSRSTFAKCQALWNKQSRSVISAENIQQAFGIHLIVPNQTRWNSTYKAIERLNRVATEKGIEVMNQLCTKLEVPQFRRPELTFINEFVTVMKPLAQALDILQSETNAYMAYLVPTLVILKEKLEHFKHSGMITNCQSLVSAILAGINARFATQMSNPELIAAAIIHPKFKVAWIKDRLGFEFLKAKLQNLQEASTANTADNNTDTAEPVTSEEDDFFTFKSTKPVSTSADSILSSYLNGGSSTFADLDNYPVLKNLFVELNTALPASAACERLFSIVGLIFAPNRSSISDEHFEQQLLLRLNAKVVS